MAHQNNILTPFLKLLNEDNTIIFSDEEKIVFDSRDKKSLFDEGLTFWPGNAGVHHANGVIVIQKNINQINLIEYLCNIVEAVKFPATG